MNYTDILISLRKIIRSINLENKQIEKKYGVSTPQVLLLNFLKSKADYQSTATELKEFLNLNASTISGIIKRLEVKKLIAKIPNSKDKRVIKISLTVEGINLINRMPEVLHEKFSDKLKCLTPAKLKSLKESMDQLVELLNAEEIDASPILSTEDTITQNNQ